MGADCARSFDELKARHLVGNSRLRKAADGSLSALWPDPTKYQAAQQEEQLLHRYLWPSEFVSTLSLLGVAWTDLPSPECPHDGRRSERTRVGGSERNGATQRPVMQTLRTRTRAPSPILRNRLAPSSNPCVPASLRSPGTSASYGCQAIVSCRLNRASRQPREGGLPPYVLFITRFSQSGH